MSTATERTLIVVLVIALIGVIGVVGFLVLNKSGGLSSIFPPDDVAVFGEDIFRLCSQGSDSTQGSLPPGSKVFPIDEQAHSRHGDIYNRLGPSRVAATRADLAAVICVRTRTENVGSKTYYEIDSGNAVAGCVLEHYVTDLFLIDINTRQTVSYVKVVGPDPTVGCPSRMSGQRVQRGEPVSIDTLMDRINMSLLVFSGDIATATTAAAKPELTSVAAVTAAATADVSDGPAAQTSQPGRLVFTCSIGGIAQIFTMTSDGQNLKQLTKDRFQNYRPVWSPDGTQIAFHSNRAGNLEVYIMNADGSRLRRLTNSSRSDMSPTWAPDGKWIAFASNRGGSYDIFIVSAAGGTPKYITSWASDETAPSWSSDGSQIAFLSNHDHYFNVYRINANGTGVKQLTFVKKNLSGVIWSPDSTQIAFSDSAGISFVNSDGTGLRRVVDTVGGSTDPAWSPDGSAVVYASSIGGKHRIYTAEIDKRIPAQLSSSEMDCWQPNWTSH